MAQEQDRASSEKPEKSSAPRMDAKEIPPEIVKEVKDILGQEAYVTPAKDNGEYKGKVLYSDDKYIIQGIAAKNGRHNNAVIHKREDLEIQNDKLVGRNKINDKNIQVYYGEKGGKLYPWNPEKAAALEKARVTERERLQKTGPDKVLSAAEKYAETIKNPKQREAFLRGVTEVAKEAFKPSEQRQKTVPPQTREKSQPKEKSQQAGMER